MSELDDRARAVGIDPTDPKYHDPHPVLAWQEGDRLCSWCARHRERHPRLFCDVRRAEAEPGQVACRWCQEPTSSRSPQWCSRCSERIEAENAKALARRRSHTSRAVYREDGLGCVERVHPSELAWENAYGPGGKGPEE